MVRYSLRCARGHGFESWFASAAAFDALAGAGHLACPECGAPEVRKAPMAPALASTLAPTLAGPSRREPALAEPRSEREARLAELRRRIEAESDYVGLRFAAEARAIHEGTAPARSIHGEARADEARALLDEGIPVAPLPFLPKRQAN